MGELNLNKWLGKDQRLFLERGYLKPGVTPEQRYQKIANTIEAISRVHEIGINTDKNAEYSMKGIGKRFEGYIEKGWVSFATPILSNFGEDDNLPISCNHGKVGDSLDSILSGLHEIGMLAKHGAGTAKNFSQIRSIGSDISTGGRSESVIKWIELYYETMQRVAQNSVRRGFFTAYLSAAHAEIEDFIKIGGKESNMPNITTGVTIPKGWMQDLKDGKSENRKIWQLLLKARQSKGFPYILFEENCNKNSPQVYIDKGLWIDNANMCAEAIEYCDDEKEFACCLSSVNMYYYDEWKDDEQFIFDMYVMLDCVNTEYINKAENLPGFQKAVKFAEEHRAVGLGVLGFHSYLQKQSVAWGSLECYRINKSVFSMLYSVGEKASRWMAQHWGEPLMMKGYGLRNSSRGAQAPTKSTAFIMGDLSEGVEAIKNNYNEKDLAKGQFEYRNPELVKLLESKNLNIEPVWKSILENNGSIQHIDSFFNDHEREVFKTFSEISQMDLIQLACQRQKYIDMGQSINLMIHPKTPAKDINKLMLAAYDGELKSLYYQYSINAAQEFNQSLLSCSSCEA